MTDDNKRMFPYRSFFKVPNAMFGSKRGPGWIDHIGPIGMAVYALILRRYDHKKGEGLYESHVSMAKRLGIAKTTVETHLAKLIELRLVDRRTHGKKRHTQWVYVPCIPMPDPRAIELSDGNRRSVGLTNRPVDGPTKGGLDHLTRVIRPFDEKYGSAHPDAIKEHNPNSEASNRLINRLNNNMCINNKVDYVATHLPHVTISTKLQVAWEYWCYRWEEHYQRRYYPAQSKENSQIIPKDKKNLRDKIQAVGFDEVIARMRRCIEVCDEMFPCVVGGQWQRPITLNDFVNNQFFDRWIEPVAKPGGPEPKRIDEKVRAAMEKRVADRGKTDESAGDA